MILFVVPEIFHQNSPYTPNFVPLSAKISAISAKNDDKEYFKYYLEFIPVKNDYKKITVAT